MATQKSVAPLLACDGIRQSYGEREVLTGISFALAQSETLAIMGRSGCGKSTLLRCLAILQEPNAGDAYLAGQQYMQRGKPLYALPEIRSHVAMVFQNLNLFGHLTGAQNVTLALKQVRKIGHTEAMELASEMAVQLGISHVLGKYPDEMSGGEAQRLALARALVLKPSVLLLDEITSALDPESVRAVIQALRKVQGIATGLKAGIIIVTHNLSFARSFADRIAFMQDGAILEIMNAKTSISELKKAESKLLLKQFEDDLSA